MGIQVIDATFLFEQPRREAASLQRAAVLARAWSRTSCSTARRWRTANGVCSITHAVIDRRAEPRTT
jgi:hypothetical protein